MNVYFDTNILLEVLLKRERFEEAKKVTDLVDKGKIKGFISGISFDTIIYILDLCFKKKGMEKELRIETLRNTLNIILDKFNVVNISNEILKQAVSDKNFNDLEDSCQFHIALSANCDYLISFNDKDYKLSSNMKVMTPSSFCDL